jgi:hypothetical protein
MAGEPEGRLLVCLRTESGREATSSNTRLGGGKIKEDDWINQRERVIISSVLFYPNIVVKLPYLQHPQSTFSYHFYSVCLPRIVLLSAFPPLDSPVWQKHLSGTLCILFKSFGVPLVSSSCVDYLKHQPLAISLQHECSSEDIPYWHKQV